MFAFIWWKAVEFALELKKTRENFREYFLDVRNYFNTAISSETRFEATLISSENLFLPTKGRKKLKKPNFYCIEIWPAKPKRNNFEINKNDLHVIRSHYYFPLSNSRSNDKSYFSFSFFWSEKFLFKFFLCEILTYTEPCNCSM